MLIATWNVNSIRTRKHQVEEFLNEVNPDLLCLQETKVQDSDFPKDFFKNLCYDVKFFGQKSYNGVALLSKKPLEDIRFGMSGEIDDSPIAIEFDEQKRVISTLIDGIRCINVYVPNGSSVDSAKYKYKLRWLNCLKEYLALQSIREEPICLLGDFNIALEDKDIHDPKRLSGGIMASNLERQALTEIISDNLEDVFRIFEQETNHWSWWDYRSGAWERDKGWRIDHIYLSKEIIHYAKSCLIIKKYRGHMQPSDHAPVVVEIDWPPNENFDEPDFFI